MTDDWTLSASKIKTAEECEERFRLRYVEGYEEMGPENRWLRRGNAVHEAIEAVLQDVSDPSVGSSVLKAAYRRNGGQTGYALSDEFHSQVLDCLEAASRFLRKNVDDVRGIEAEVEFAVDRTGITRDYGGFIDLASDSVVDWKTGKSEGKESHEAIQGAVYMGGYYDEYGEPPEAIQFVYLNPQAGDDHPMVRTIEPDDDVWDEMIRRSRDLLATVDTGQYEPTVSDDTCTFCDFEVHCSYSPVGAGDIPWSLYP